MMSEVKWKETLIMSKLWYTFDQIYFQWEEMVDMIAELFKKQVG